MRQSRHKHVLDALCGAMRQVGGITMEVRREPQLAMLPDWERNPDAPPGDAVTMPRADIYWLHAYAQKRCIGDLVMRHPQAADAAAPCASKPGAAAEEAYAGKLAKYQSRWRFPAESGGY